MSRIFAFSILASIVAITIAPAVHLQKAPPARVTVIKAGHLIDVKAGVTRDNQMIIVEGERIKSVGANLSVPDGAQVIDLSRSTVLPGLIDCHTHLLQNLARVGSESDAMLLNVGNRSTAERALLGVAMGREDLESGITTVRDLGNSGVNGDVALRNAIRSGWVTGPRIIAATRALSPAGGQFENLPPAVAKTIVEQEYVPITGPDEARRAVREAIFSGADLIKVIVDNFPPMRLLNEEELRAIVDEAHRSRVKVATHAITNQAIHEAAVAGVDSIEHGYFINDENLRLMHDKGIYLVPTDSDNPPKFYVDRLQRALKLGVKIVFGSDVYGATPGKTRGEKSMGVLVAYQQAGMSPLGIIRTATTNAADLLGWQDAPGSLTPMEEKFVVDEDQKWQELIGSIEVGHYADLIAVNGDPLKDISELQRVSFVMKGGAVIKQGTSNGG